MVITFKTGDTAGLTSSLAAPPSLPTFCAFSQNTITVQEKEFGVKSNKTDKAEVKQGKGICQ